MIKKIFFLFILFNTILLPQVKTWKLISPNHEGNVPADFENRNPAYSYYRNGNIIYLNIYGDYKAALWKFNLLTDEWQEIFRSNIPLSLAQIIVSPKAGKYYGLWPYLGKVFEIDDKFNWIEMGDNTNSYEYTGTNYFINPMNDKIMAFFGYGFYKLKNDVQIFNPVSNKWEIIPVKGKRPEPRSGGKFDYSKNDTSLYFFGGIGGEAVTNNYINKYFYDLWKFDLRKYGWTNIIKSSKIKNIIKIMYVGKTNSLYAVATEINKPVSVTEIYKYDIGKSKDFYKILTTKSMSFSPDYCAAFYDEKKNRIILIQAIGSAAPSLTFQIWELSLN
jgi:hypothetical protein